MKKLYTILLVLISPCLYAQSPWATAGATWYYGYTNYWTHFGYLKYEKTGDTLISGINCDNILATRHVFSYISNSFQDDTTHEYTYIDNNIVYRWFDNHFIILYKFGALAGDTWELPHDNSCQDPPYVLVDSISDTLINSTVLKQLHVTVNGFFSYSTTITEKIGGDDGLFPEIACITDMPESSFRCYVDGQGWSYSNNSAPACDFTTNAIAIDPLPSIAVFPNPADNKIFIQGNINGKSVALMNVLGKPLSCKFSSDENTAIDISKLAAGIYFLRMENESGFRTLKFIKQ